MARAVVIGAGMIGLLAAYHLMRRGVDVTLVDQGEPGMGCSFGNAGWICPSLSAPLPAPGLPLRSLRWMLSRGSPLYIAPTAMPGMLGWLLAFWRSCDAARNAAGLAAMLELNSGTFAQYDALRADGVEFEMHEGGVLFSFLSARELQAEYEDLARIGEHGFAPPRLLSREAALAEEPVLSPAIAGGVLLPAERHVEPLSLSRGVLQHLRRAGVPVHAGTRVRGFARKGDLVRAALADDGPLEADLFVLAAGAKTGDLAKALGAFLPLQAGKGYSITYPGVRLNPRHALYFGDTKVVLSQYDGALRVAGSMEFSGFNERLDAARVDALRGAAQRYLRDPLPGGGSAWSGMRPMLPDGLPAIGRLAGLQNVYVSTGHATNGVFMAPSSGEALAELALRGAANVDLAPFDPARFGRN